MGCDLPRWTPPRRGTLTRAVADAAVAGAGRRSADGHHQPRAEERVSRARTRRPTPRSSAPRRAKWTESTDYYLGTTVDQVAAQQIGPRDAAAVARAVDGPAADGRPVRQRLRLRLPEQPVVVVADHAAAGRGASAHRVRAAVRRRRQRGRSPGRAAASAPACSTGSARTSRACSGQLGPEDRARVDAVSRHRARGRAAHPEGRGRDRGRSRCPISIVRPACRRRMPTTRG